MSFTGNGLARYQCNYSKIKSNSLLNIAKQRSSGYTVHIKTKVPIFKTKTEQNHNKNIVKEQHKSKHMKTQQIKTKLFFLFLI